MAASWVLEGEGIVEREQPARPNAGRDELLGAEWRSKRMLST